MTNTSATTYRSLLNDATESIYDISDTPRIDAEILMQHITKQSMSWLVSFGDTIATNQHIEDFFSVVEQRLKGEPIAYIIGSREFWTLDLLVNEHVLIPRPDTETLVEHGLNVLKNISTPDILDLGTGSGAIALSLAKELPYSNVIAIDAHQNALNVAIENATRNSINNVKFLLSNWFRDLEQQKFDLIAANPPYVDANNEHLTKGDLRFEPNTALIANNNGLSDLEVIIENAANFLKPNAYLIVEHGYKQQNEVESLFKQNGFSNVQCHHDINKLPRCTIGQLMSA